MHQGIVPPRTEEELLARARALAGLSVGGLARRLDQCLRTDVVRTKGRVGELVEMALGATAGTLDGPDFPHLGVELKTIPVDGRGRVAESTYVCYLSLNEVEQEEWEESRVWRKLRRVLWVPVEASTAGPLAERRLGYPVLWSPGREQRALIGGDWMDLVGRIAVGGIEEISAHMGQVLQIRPKAKDSTVTTEVLGPEGEVLSTGPRGFYLRARFTESILSEGLEAGGRRPEDGTGEPGEPADEPGGNP